MDDLHLHQVSGELGVSVSSGKPRPTKETIMRSPRKPRGRATVFLLLLGVLLCVPPQSDATLISSDSLFLPPTLVAKAFYVTHYPALGGTQVYTAADLGADSLLGARILPLLKPNPSASRSQGEYTEADLAAINISNYSSFFFRQPNVDYFADLTPSTLAISYPTTGQYFVEVSAEKDGVEFTRIFHDQVDDFFEEDPPKAPKDKASVSRVIASPTADLIIVSDGDPRDNGANRDAFETLTKQKKNVQKANSLDAAIKLISDEFKKNGDKKISIVLIGHGRPGSIKIGKQRINNDPDSDMTPDKFQKLIDHYVKSVEFYSCNTARGKKGAKFLDAFRSSIDQASGFDDPITIAGPSRKDDGYFDTGATGRKVVDVAEPPVFLLFIGGYTLLLGFLISGRTGTTRRRFARPASPLS